MKILSFTIIMLVILASCNSQSGTKKSPSLTLVWETADTLKVPESVKYDSENNVLYVSNMAEDSEENLENGFISKLDLDGNIIELEWVTGLITPKGMGIYDGKLFVTDLFRVAKIDIASGEIEKFYPNDNAVFLNDIDISADGQVFVSDWKAQEIYTIQNDSLVVWLSSEEIAGTNGLFVQDGKLLAGLTGAIVQIDLVTKSVLRLVNTKEGMIDGLEAVSDNQYIISDWQGRIHLASPDSTKILLIDKADEKINAADIEYIPEKQLVLVPTFFANKVMAYKLDL